MEVKLQHIHVNDGEFEELESIKRDLTRPYTGSELTKIMGYILAGLIIISAIAPILF
ncbi:TPA: multidrug effflux MFS transporter [Methanocaldococcus jannaschii]|uniref:Multidrug effflux MFS transporter n=1 Tax=Methanocaldococcus jannaschii TaxID=2190 RepID=A0A832T692_9EURY|nr:multidrug effflux MFS transporter [Methanocaldococcus jannaschii]HII59759.1 multidrug effflux MFS transporter [Methanocaldococcus jannaschii]